MSITNQPFTNLLNNPQPLIEMTNSDTEYHVHSNHSNDSIHLVHMSADCIEHHNSNSYNIEILVEEATSYRTDPESSNIFL